MARLSQPPSFYGTWNGICVYHMFGKDFIRTASSLTGERVKTDPCFRNTMASASRMAHAARLASAVYSMLPGYKRKHPLYRKLTGRAARLLKRGMGEGETVVELLLMARLPKKKAAKIAGGRTAMRLNRRKKNKWAMISDHTQRPVRAPFTGHYTREAIRAFWGTSITAPPGMVLSPCTARTA
jgi:hypothetical protein